MIVVADASACASFLLPDEAGPFAVFARETIATHQIHVPSHWPVELASILRNAHRRKRIEEADLTRLAQVATDIAANISIAASQPISVLIEAGARLRLTPYDAAYVALAQALGASVLTTDQAMARACVDAGIAVLQP